MRSILAFTFVMLLAVGRYMPARADDSEPRTIVEEAIKAIGGEAKLSMAKAFTWKTKGKLRFGDNESSYTAQATVAGLDKFRQEFEGEFGGNQVKGVTVLNGDRAWRSFGDRKMELDAAAVANEKRTLYLQSIPVASLLPLKSDHFRMEAAGDEKVGDAEAAGIKVTAPDGKDFKLYFDKTNKLPVKVVADVRGFGGDEFTQETLYRDYKDFDGIKKATKIEAKRNGETFLEAELIEFKVLNEIDPETFAEPK